MLMIVQLSGSALFTAQVDCVPTVGSLVRVKTESYKKGLYPGSVIEFAVTNAQPPEFDFTETPPVAYLDANGYRVIVEGTATD